MASRQEWNGEGTRAPGLEFVLDPSSVKEQVVVSAARAEVRLSDTPGSNVLLSTTDVAAAPALRVDDVLREVPGFSLFRRSGSRTANASSQGVSLRGLGGSAASRALVLVDGISLVDPFGGWVTWDRLPSASIATVEVVRGGASNLYGSDAMGGVVQFDAAAGDTGLHAGDIVRKRAHTRSIFLDRKPYPQVGLLAGVTRCFVPAASFWSRMRCAARSILRRIPRTRLSMLASVTTSEGMEESSGAEITSPNSATMARRFRLMTQILLRERAASTNNLAMTR